MNSPDKKSLWIALLGSVAAAVLFVLACPPFGYWAAAWLVPGVLLVSLRRLPYRHAFEGGLLFGVLSAGLVTRWLPDSLVLGFDLSPLAASLIAFGGVTIAVGVPCGLLTLAYAYASRRVSTYDLPIVGTFFWVASEWARAQFLGWELLGHTQFRQLWLIQIADLGGVFAVSFVVAFVSISLVEMVTGVATRALTVTAGVRAMALPAVTLAIAIVYGAGAGDLYRAGPAETVSSIDSQDAFSVPLLQASWSPASSAARPSAALPELSVRRVSTIEQSGVRVSPLLCEDILDADLVRAVVAEGADVLINNCRVPWMADATTGAAEQHLALAVFRSVESRRFVVRATNHGQAELITALGATHTVMPRGRSLRISTDTTRYQKYGNQWMFLGFGLSLIVIGRGRRDSTA